MDSLANRQHSCRGSEELAIRKTARFQATPSYSELLRVGGAQETPSYSELLRATPSYSELLRVGGAQELRTTTRTHSFESTSVSHCNIHLSVHPRNSEWRPRTPSHSELLRATPSYSDLLRVAPKNSELLYQEVCHIAAYI